MASEGIAIGIDFGTTNTCAVAHEHGNISSLVNGQGDRTTPSYVAFDRNKFLVGHQAKERAFLSPKNTVYDLKRMIGRQFNDPVVKSLSKDAPFVIIEKNGKPEVLVQSQSGEDEAKEMEPEKLVGQLMKTIKKPYDQCVDREIKHGVIAVPVHFNEDQKVALQTAAQMAGLEDSIMIEEPKAAALAYVSTVKDAATGLVLVVDFGGGSLDVTLVNIGSDNSIQIIKSLSAVNLGGRELDDIIVTQAVAEFQKIHQMDLSLSERAMGRVRAAAERAKHTLSASESAKIKLHALFKEQNFKYRFERKQFEEWCHELFDKVKNLIDEVIRMANKTHHDVKQVLLVGGCSKIPKVREIIEGCFGRREMINDMTAEDTVAKGAAICAFNLSQSSSSDKAALSVGIEVRGRLLHAIIHRDSPLPITKKHVFEPRVNSRGEAKVRVYRGERLIAEENEFLGEMVFRFDLEVDKKKGTVKPKVQPMVEVEMTVNVSGVLTVIAHERRTQTTKRLTIQLNRDTYDIRKMIEKAQKKRPDEEIYRKQQLAKIWLWNYAHQTLAWVKDQKIARVIPEKKRKKIADRAKKTIWWLDAYSVPLFEYVQRKHRKLDKKVLPVIDLFREHQTMPANDESSYLACTQLSQNLADMGVIVSSTSPVNSTFASSYGTRPAPATPRPKSQGFFANNLGLLPISATR